MTALIRHLVSRRAMLIGVGSVLAVSAIVLSNPWRAIAGITAILVYGAVLLQLSLRLSQSHKEVQTLRRELAQLELPASIEEAETPDPRPAKRLAYAVGRLEQSDTDLDRAARDLVSAEGHGDKPVITVVIPCYNEQRFVAETLESVLAQSFADWEAIVVDDASTDDSLAEVWSVAEKDDRIRVLRHQVNSGLSAARNTGLRAARGRFVTFLDSDDLLLADSLLDRLVALVNALGDPHVIGSYSDVKVDLEDVRLDDYPPRLRRHTNTTFDFVAADSECPFPAHAPLLITETLRRLGGFDEQMRNGAEDWDLWYRVMRNGYVFVPSSYRTIVYRQKRGSMVREMTDLHLEEAMRLIDAAHRDVDPGIIVNPSPTPLTKPLGHYRSILRRADRSVRSAAISLVSGRPESARRSLEVFEEAPLGFMERHLDIQDLVDRGIRRTLSINPEELETLRSLAVPYQQQVHAMISGISRNRVGEDAGSAEPPFVPALLVPQHRGELPVLLEAALSRGFSTDDLGVLIVEREAGCQGVSAAIPPDTPLWTLNEWTLNGASTTTVFVGRVRMGVADRFVAAVATAGGEVVGVEQEEDSLMELEAAHSSRDAEQETDPANDGSGPFVGLEPIRTGGKNVEPTEVWQIEEYPGTRFDAVDIARFKDSHRGERVVIIGNGPSLNKTDLSALADEFTIAVNGIFYAAERMGFDPTYYVVEDTAFMRDNLDSIMTYRARHKFFPSLYRELVGTHDDVSYFMMNRGFYEQKSPDFCIPRFSTDATQRIYSGQSVTIINLQLAYYMGFEEVVLIGMDFSYSIPDDAVKEGDLVTSMGDDPNHFHPDYFGAGKVWKDPKLDRVLANYALAKRVFEASGRRIVNATNGGHLDLFDRVDFGELFG